MLVGLRLFDHKDAQCNQERAASVERESSSNEVEARMSVDRSIQQNFFYEHQAPDLQVDRDAMNKQAEISEQTMDYSNVFGQDLRVSDDTEA